MRATWLFGTCAILVVGSACATPEPAPFAALHQHAPAMSAQARLPAYTNVGSAYQDYNGPAVVVRSGPSTQDTGGERMATFPAGGAPIAQGAMQVILPNGGERPVRSENSQP